VSGAESDTLLLLEHLFFLERSNLNASEAGQTLYPGEDMTNFRGTVKDGQLVFPVEVTEQLGLHEGDAVEVPEAVLAAARAQDAGNPFTAWIGTLPPFSDGQDAASFTRSLRDPDDEAS
jgi:hypothetical protein